MQVTEQQDQRRSSAPSRSTLGLVLAVVAALGALSTCSWLGTLLAGAHGSDSFSPPVLQDTTQPHVGLMRILFSIQALWMVMGVIALVLGIATLRTRHALSKGLATVALAVLAPVASIALLVTLAG
ncbi:MAG: hypothetical protein LKI24_15880 [Acidipropionibacterium sp.]|jgi:uncharacterized membrane protein YidH (DUF202 family)|nr:hypothetical protein [Acidipropionibacterium sp.]